ncbi:membrane progestin receptor alpha-B-like [Parambassis ranga]|uniref:Membrane progestin receptor alpha-B-like n=1 Tax=Parambassis ranga TaxID=210632 RepID=A0A6P7HLQ6_9TELE|nr:membrane progestin receptor alpha-B-like [Parambassis ranga]XP_028251487.1 membrane progestin receptor alpha-B-like [Parambassis ranga]
MAIVAMEQIGRVFISLQEIRQIPRMLTEAVPSMPNTVRDSEVPNALRERYVFTGYRPLNQSWRYYLLSLFQRHNETVNAWTHLLAFLVILVKLHQITETVDFVGDPHSWPLLILILSCLNYSAFSAAAHLLGGKSELSHNALFFLDYFGVAQYQYGSGVVHFYYAVDESMHRHVQGIFMPTATILSCLSCLGCCFGKYWIDSKPWVSKVGQVLPSALAYIWDSSPVTKRLLYWSTDDPSMIYYLGQVVFFLSSAFFFIFRLPECCFPGRFDVFGQSHQIFHVLLTCCTLCQIHTYQLEYINRRMVYSQLHKSSDAALFLCLYVVELVVTAFIAVFLLQKIKQALELKNKSK